MRTKRSFVEFLIQNNAVEEYTSELFKCKGINLSEHFGKHPGDTNHHIGGAFVWASTPSGQGFWHKLHHRWMSFGFIAINKNTRVI